MKNGYLFLTLLLLFFVMLCGCEQQTERPQTEDSAKVGGMLVAAIKSDITNLNPLFPRSVVEANVRDMMFLKLLRRDQNLNLHASDYKPCLTKSWRFSEDFLELTLYLNEDVVWSDGTPVTAHDVKFTFDKMLDPVINYPYKSDYDFVDTCRVVDTFTIAFRFTEVYANELEDISYIVPLPAHVFEGVSSSDMLSHPYNAYPNVINGPYRLTANEDSRYTLEVNSQFSFQRPNLDRIVFEVIPDATERLVRLKQEEVDLITSLLPEQAQQLQANTPQIKVYNYSSLSYDFVRWLNTNPLFESPVVRRALTMAINRQAIIDELWLGYAEECLGPIHPSQAEFYNPNLTPLPYDPDQARQMLAEHGWDDHDGDGVLDKNGEAFRFTIKTAGNYPDRLVAMDMIRSDLAAIGIIATPDTVEYNTLISQMRDREYEAAIAGMRMDERFDPTPTWHSSAIGHGGNYVNYRNARIDSLIDLGRRTLARNEARAIWYEFQEALYADQPVTFLFVVDHLDAVNQKFKGIETWPRGIFFNIEEWWIDQPENSN